MCKASLLNLNADFNTTLGMEIALLDVNDVLEDDIIIRIKNKFNTK